MTLNSYPCSITVITHCIEQFLACDFCHKLLLTSLHLFSLILLKIGHGSFRVRAWVVMDADPEHVPCHHLPLTICWLTYIRICGQKHQLNQTGTRRYTVLQELVNCHCKRHGMQIKVIRTVIEVNWNWPDIQALLHRSVFTHMYIFTSLLYVIYSPSYFGWVEVFWLTWRTDFNSLYRPRPKLPYFKLCNN